jgi:hypothetical protein
MFCPYCNSPLEDGPAGQMRCSASGVGFGAAVSQSLRNRFAKSDPSGWTGTCPETQLGVWFCPGCGIEMVKHRCPRCGEGIDGLLHHQLVELNPHVRPNPPMHRTGPAV